MSQTTTQRYSSQGAPGHCYSQTGERETEPLCLPTSALSFVLTLAGTDPSVAGDYVVSFPSPSGGTVTSTYTSPGTIVLATEGTNLKNSLNADPIFSRYFTASNVGAVLTVTANSPSLNLALADISTSNPVGTTLTASALTAAGGLTLRMGVLCKYGADAVGPAVTGTMREARPAAPLATGDTVANIRGMVMRQVNATTLAADFDESAPDAYASPDIFPVLNRGEGALVVDPSSGAITRATTPIYAVLAVGTNLVVGALTDTADGGNTTQVDTADFLRLLGDEFNPTFGTPRQRLVRCKINRGN